MLIIQCGHQRSGGVLQYNLVKSIFLIKDIKYADEGWCTWQRFGQVFNKYLYVPMTTLLKTHPYLPGRYPSLIDTDFKALYTYRDPRDAMISQMKLSGITFEEALPVVKSWREQYYAWTKLTSNVLASRYEDFIEDIPSLVSNMVAFLGYDLTDEQIEHVANANSIQRAKAKISKQDDEFDTDTLLHKKHITNSGKVGGWREMLDNKQLRTLYRKFGRWMKDMGYEKEYIEDDN